jgi:hypothetical protein
LERYFQDLFNGILKFPKFLKLHLVKPKEILATAEQAGQKNCNGKTIAVLFLNDFYECVEGKSGIYLLLTMFIGDEWMVDLMIL